MVFAGYLTLGDGNTIDILRIADLIFAQYCFVTDFMWRGQVVEKQNLDPHDRELKPNSFCHR